MKSRPSTGKSLLLSVWRELITTLRTDVFVWIAPSEVMYVSGTTSSVLGILTEMLFCS